MIQLLTTPAHERTSWFAVQVTPRHENKVDMMLGYKGYARFLPTYKVRRNWSDRIKTLEQPLFPGYLFCRTFAGSLSGILGTPGVIRILSFAGKPYQVPDEEVESLQQAIHSGRPLQRAAHLSIGRRVEIKAGPLAGIIGIITEYKNQERLVLCVDSIMKAVAIDVDASEVIAMATAPVMSGNLKQALRAA